MAESNKYTWIPAYEAIATRLLDFEGKQNELTAIVQNVIGDSFDKMDPLTFFSMFNGKLRREDRRIEAVEKVVWAIPITDARQWRFWGGEAGQVEDNWSVFRSALVFADMPSAETRAQLIRGFDAAKARKNVGNSNLSMALYWARPKSYLPLDGNTQAYLRNRYGIVVPAQLTGESYLQLVDEVRATTGASFTDISYAAWELGGWIPAPSEWDPGVNADRWEGLLGDPSIADKSVLISLKCMAEHPKGVTCAELADEYGRGPAFYSNAITALGRRVSDRLGIEPQEVEKGKYWPVACVGNYVAKRRKGTFEWRLRGEVLEAVRRLDLTGVTAHEPDDAEPWFDEGRLRRLIGLYKADFGRFRGNSAPKGDQESYKWDRVANFQENWDIDADDFSGHATAALKPAAQGMGQLLGSGHEYSFDRLMKLLVFDEEGVRDAFKALYDTTSDIAASYEAFTKCVNDLVGRYNESSGSTMDDAYQNAKAASVYLFFRYPERYHYYKPTVADSLCAAVGSVLPSDPTARFVAYEALCDAMMPAVMSDRGLVALSDSVLDGRQLAADPAHHLLLQDIGYYCDAYMKDWHPDWEDLLEDADGTNPVEVEPPMTAQKRPNNIILYGPPGTGKTFYVPALAWLISKGVKPTLSAVKALSNEELADAKAWYDSQVADRDGGQVAFTTFHQSYDYEEFIEGIRPSIATDDDSEDSVSGVTYSYEDGIFKSFCRRASKPITTEAANDFGFNANPAVWKVSLAGTGPNPVRTECLANGHIRIGWDDYGAEITDDTDFSLYGGKKVLNAFIARMRKGDIVLSCFSQTTIDAIGVVTGDVEWHDEYDKYRRLREVKWIATGLDFDIVQEFDLPIMTLSAVYRLNRLSEPDVLSILDNTGATKQKVTLPNERPYIFVIDEINRGSVSKVFGELITLIEVTKREGMPEQQVAILPYTKEPFSVPSNVHIIGTMNTADRSIALMDTALRRRFSFVEVMPDPSLLGGLNVDGVDVARMLSVMNDRIELLYDREHTLGHAYFMGLRDAPTVGCLRDIFRDRIIPLLQEYFFDDYGKIRSVLGAAADDFIERRDTAGVFWEGDAGRYDTMESYRVREIPSNPEAYARIYQSGIGA